MTGVELIAAERQRQIAVEGWTQEHDDEHGRCALLRAARCYAKAANMLLFGHRIEDVNANVYPEWPWDAEWLKISPDPICNIVKAAALLAAEIDRLQRIEKVNCD